MPSAPPRGNAPSSPAKPSRRAPLKLSSVASVWDISSLLLAIPSPHSLAARFVSETSATLPVSRWQFVSTHCSNRTALARAYPKQRRVLTESATKRESSRVLRFEEQTEGERTEQEGRPERPKRAPKPHKRGHGDLRLNRCGSRRMILPRR